jgi:hypothetical protein
MLRGVLEALPRSGEPRGEAMIAPDEVVTMVRLKALGWGVRPLASVLGARSLPARVPPMDYLDKPTGEARGSSSSWRPWSSS